MSSLDPVTFTMFIGLKQSGKSFRASKIPNSIDINFASSLVEIVSTSLYSDLRLIESPELYAKFKHSKLLYRQNITGRNILQNLGTSIRDVDSDFFVTAWTQKVKRVLEEGKYKNITCSDARFINEVKAIESIFWRDLKIVFCDYHSNNYDPDDLHESEALARGLKLAGFKDGDILSIKDIENVVNNNTKK